MLVFGEVDSTRPQRRHASRSGLNIQRTPALRTSDSKIAMYTVYCIYKYVYNTYIWVSGPGGVSQTGIPRHGCHRHHRGNPQHGLEPHPTIPKTMRPWQRAPKAQGHEGFRRVVSPSAPAHGFHEGHWLLIGCSLGFLTLHVECHAIKVVELILQSSSAATRRCPANGRARSRPARPPIGTP